jgi:hypothetical protein
MIRENFTHIDTFDLLNSNLTEEKIEKLSLYVSQADLRSFKFTEEHTKLFKHFNELIFKGHNTAQLEDCEMKTLIFKNIMTLKHNNVLYPLYILALFSTPSEQILSKIDIANQDFKTFVNIFTVSIEFAISDILPDMITNSI